MNKFNTNISNNSSETIRYLQESCNHNVDENLDMNGVDPLRWAEVRQRISMIKEFLTIASPTAADRQRFGESIGLSSNQFMALVRAWKTHGVAAKIAGSGSSRGAPRRPSRLGVTETAKEMVAAVIRELGSDAPFVDVNRTVASRCSSQGIPCPSRTTVWNTFKAGRQIHHRHDNGIVIGTCHIRIPVQVDGSVVLPQITLAVRTHDGAVLAAAMHATFINWSSVAAYVAGIETNVRIGEDLLPNLIAGEPTLIPVPATAARSLLSRVLGRGIDDIQLVYRIGKALSPERLLTAKEDRPLEPSDAHRITAAAVTRHNASRGATDAIWIVVTSRPDTLM